MSDTTAIERDRFTWGAYLMLGWFAFMQATIGPIMPFLRDELHLNFAVAGLHMTTYAFGIAVTGLCGDRIVAQLGRRLVFWGGAFGMSAGATVLVLAKSPSLSLLGTWLMGLLGGLLVMLIHATLADHHGEQRNFAITEANIIASVAACFCPLLIGAFQQGGGGWRVAMLLAAAVAVVIAALFLKEPVPKAPPCEALQSKLPREFWPWWTVMFFAIAVETSMGMWAAIYLEAVVGLSKIWSATLMGVFFASAAVGRIVALRLAHKFPPYTLLRCAFIIAGVGLILFWLTRIPMLAITGLVLCGIGISNFFPQTLALAVATCPGQSDAASARLFLAVGLAGLTIPFCIGLAADHTSLYAAYSIVALVLLTAALAAQIGAKKMRGHNTN